MQTEIQHLKKYQHMVKFPLPHSDVKKVNKRDPKNAQKVHEIKLNLQQTQWLEFLKKSKFRKK